MARTRSKEPPDPHLCWNCRWFHELPVNGPTCIYWVKPVEPDHSCKSWCDPNYRWPIPEEKRDRYMGAD